MCTTCCLKNSTVTNTFYYIFEKSTDKSSLWQSIKKLYEKIYTDDPSEVYEFGKYNYQ